MAKAKAKNGFIVAAEELPDSADLDRVQGRPDLDLEKDDIKEMARDLGARPGFPPEDLYVGQVLAISEKITEVSERTGKEYNYRIAIIHFRNNGNGIRVDERFSLKIVGRQAERLRYLAETGEKFITLIANVGGYKRMQSILSLSDIRQLLGEDLEA